MLAIEVNGQNWVAVESQSEGHVQPGREGQKLTTGLTDLVGNSLVNNLL